MAQAENHCFNSVNTETSFCRGEEGLEIVRTQLLGTVNKPDLLIVGVGMDAGLVQCPYVPFRFSALFEAAQQPFQMTLLDCDPEIRWDLLERERLFLPSRYFKKDQTIRKSWQRYLADTSQEDQLTHARMSGMKFEYDDYGDDDDSDIYQTELMEGIHYANIPKNFRHMRSSGALSILTGDIGSVSLPEESFDYVSCMNVLYMLNKKAQQHAIGEMARTLKTGGLLEFNDIGGIQGTSVFKDLGGWLEYKDLMYFGLEAEQYCPVAEQTEEDSFITEANSIKTVLRKK